jgi:hypothetical protein
VPTSQPLANYTDFCAGRVRILLYRLGIIDLGDADQQTKAIVVAFSALVSVLVKAGVDNGTWTDTQLATILDAAIAGATPGWMPPTLQVPLNVLLGT